MVLVVDDDDNSNLSNKYYSRNAWVHWVLVVVHRLAEYGDGVHDDVVRFDVEDGTRAIVDENGGRMDDMLTNSLRYTLQKEKKRRKGDEEDRI